MTSEQMLVALKANPFDEVGWLAVADALEEEGNTLHANMLRGTADRRDEDTVYGQVLDQFSEFNGDVRELTTRTIREYTSYINNVDPPHEYASLLERLGKSLRVYRFVSAYSQPSLVFRGPFVVGVLATSNFWHLLIKHTHTQLDNDIGILMADSTDKFRGLLQQAPLCVVCLDYRWPAVVGKKVIWKQDSGKELDSIDWQCLLSKPLFKRLQAKPFVHASSAAKYIRYYTTVQEALLDLSQAATTALMECK